MTIQDFIAAYNKSFRYIEKKYGTEALRKLWSTISNDWCTHLDDCVKRKGLVGLMEYWGGDSGILTREHAAYEVHLKDDHFRGVMHECPSVAEVRSRGQEPYVGSLTYCDHCEALYSPICAKYGIDLHFKPEYNNDGSCAGRCTWDARKVR